MKILQYVMVDIMFRPGFPLPYVMCHIQIKFNFFIWVFHWNHLQSAQIAEVPSKYFVPC